MSTITKSTTKLQQLELDEASENVDATRTNKERAVHRLKKFGGNSSLSAAVYEFKSKSIVKRLLWGLIVISAIAGFVTSLLRVSTC